MSAAIIEKNLTAMTKEELRTEYQRLTKLDTIKDCLDLFDIFLEYLWSVINEQQGKKVDSYPNRDAEILNQMMFTKLTHLKKLIEGVGYTARNGTKLNAIIDPTIVASLTRNIFETVSVFNLIYRNTNTEDEKDIIYYLWVSSGLKYRQRFQSDISTPDDIIEANEERKQIEQLENEIKNTALYKSLDAKNQSVINKKLNKKDYRVRFDGKKVISLDWQEMCDVMKLKKELFDNIYTYFSLYSHPSNVSVLQFADMFSKEDEAFISLTTMNLRYCFSLMSVFIADYINLFPDLLNIFEKSEIHKQIALNTHNKMLRGDAYSINDAWKDLY